MCLNRQGAYVESVNLKPFFSWGEGGEANGFVKVVHKMLYYALHIKSVLAKTCM